MQKKTKYIFISTGYRGGATTFINDHLDYLTKKKKKLVLIDDNPYKKGMIMPVGNLEIVGSDSLYSRDVRLCLLGLNPLNQSKVVVKHTSFTKKNGIFASIFPGTTLDLEKII